MTSRLVKIHVNNNPCVARIDRPLLRKTICQMAGKDENSIVTWEADGTKYCGRMADEDDAVIFPFSGLKLFIQSCDDNQGCYR